MPRPFTYVQQEHDSGCSIAAVAMVVGAPYRRILRELFPNKTYRNGRLQIALTSAGIRRSLRKYGIESYIDRPARLPRKPALLFFDWHEKEDGVRGFHVVIRTADGRFLDPNWNEPCEPDFYMKRWRASGRETLVLEVP
jgi:hypothetical protein